MKTKLKNFSSKWGLFNILMLLVCALCFIFGGFEAGVVMAVVVAGGIPEPNYGDAVLDDAGVMFEGEVSLTEASQRAPELISKHFVKEVIRIGAGKYPTMSLIHGRYFLEKKKTKDHIIQVSRITTPPVQITTASAVTNSMQNSELVEMDFGTGNSIINLGQTIIFPTIKGFKKDGTTRANTCLQCRVMGRNNGKLLLKAVDCGQKVGAIFTLPLIPAGTMALRSDRIGTETQLRSEPFGIAPSPTDYFVAKKLIEFQTTGWYDSATKNIKWERDDIKEAALIEFMRTSAPSFWLGTQAEIIAPEYTSNQLEKAYYTGGLISQASRDLNLGGTLDIKALLNLQKIAFSDNNSSREKYFAMGDELAPRMQELVFNTPGLSYNTYKDTKLGINMTEVVFFGGKSIKFIEEDSLNDCGLNDYGFVLDPAHVSVYSYGYEFLPLDGRKTQTRDVKGLSVIEESVNILTNQEAHVVVKL